MMVEMRAGTITKKVIIVDDDRGILESVALIVEMAGYEVATSVDGAGLLTHLEPPPDLILLDILLMGEDGRELCRNLKSQAGSGHIPVILMSAHASRQLALHTSKADAFLAKPFDMDNLLTLLQLYAPLTEPALASLVPGILSLQRADPDFLLKPPPHPEEEARIEDLYCLHLLDTPPEERFDAIVQRARHLFEVPIVLIGLIDVERQWYKSCIGLASPEAARDDTFCAHTILSKEPLIVPDASKDPRFSSNPYVAGPPHIRFYAGHPLCGPHGYPIGTLCLVDYVCRELTGEQMDLLHDLASQVEKEFVSTASFREE
jgi:CheY-like chemotaxis protein